MDGLARDNAPEVKAADFGSHTEVMLPKSWVQNQVHAFKLATLALKDAAIADVRAAHYARMVGRSLTDDPKATPDTLCREIPKTVPSGRSLLTFEGCSKGKD